MQALETLTNHCRSHAAVTRKTVADGSEITLSHFTEISALGRPATDTLSNPSLLAVGRSNPNSGPFAVVVYAQSPLGFKVVDIFVGDGLLTERVYDHQVVFVQHELRSHPHEQSANHNKCADGILNPIRSIVGRVQNDLSHEKHIKPYGQDGPGEVSFGSKDNFVFHASSIAGYSAVQERK